MYKIGFVPVNNTDTPKVVVTPSCGAKFSLSVSNVVLAESVQKSSASPALP